MVKIDSVAKHSKASRHFIKPGDLLISVNGCEIDDVLDYRFRMTAEKTVLVIERNGKRRTVRIRKPEEETEIGLGFETPLMDGKRSCLNKCVFCFIDQNPKGMRESIYFKDDDSRLSFLHGNYITMTNLSEHEIDRIIEMHISPVNISVHTTNPELRCRMMNNRFAGKTLSYLKRFADAGIRICAQVVLCRGINDGEELDRTMKDLTAYIPALDSCSIVPAGLTKHREGLCKLELFTSEECRRVVEQITAFGDFCEKEYGSRLFYASDEFYVRGGIPLPDEEFYGDFSQLQDGVGMLTLFGADAKRTLDALKEDGELPDFGAAGRRVTVVTGAAAFDEITKVSRMAEKYVPGLSVNVLKIRNDFFGETVTVSGLLTGGDIAAQTLEAVKNGVDLGEKLFFPRNALRADGDLFLDDTTPEMLADRIGIPAETSGPDGDIFIENILGIC